MKNRTSYRVLQGIGLAGGLVVLVSIGCDSALARGLGAAATTYTNTIKTIGQGMSVAGVIAGGICMQLPGVAGFGRNVLAGGLIGGLCSFGAPAFVALLNSVFGGG
jgi:hypothetical protein